MDFLRNLNLNLFLFEMEVQYESGGTEFKSIEKFLCRVLPAHDLQFSTRYDPLNPLQVHNDVRSKLSYTPII